MLFAVFLGLGLANVFGQRVETTSVDSGVADGGHVLSYDSVAAGTQLVVGLQYQVNPTTMGTRDQDVVLVEDGKAIEPNLERERITLEELAAQARLKEIDSISDVRWAVLETSGAITFIPRSK